MKSLRKIAGQMLLALLSVGVVLGIVEGMTRWKSPAVEEDLKREILTGCDFKEQFLKDAAGVSWHRYYEYWLFAACPFTSATISITDYFSSRRVPASAAPGSGGETIWLFGGSTMFDIGTDDEHTIANSLAKELKRSGLHATVVNFGADSFASSQELIKFEDLLRRNPDRLRPTMVVFYDGYNDAYHGCFFGAGNMQGDISSKIEAVVNQRVGLYYAVRLSDVLSRHFVLWKKTLGTRLSRKLLWKRPSASAADNAADTLRIYRDNIRMVRAICAEFHIRPLFVLQPVLLEKTPLTSLEKRARASEAGAMEKFLPEFYQQAREILNHEPDFLDLSRAFDGIEKDVFFDGCHLGPYFSEPIGQAIARKILTMERGEQPKLSAPSVHPAE